MKDGGISFAVPFRHYLLSQPVTHVQLAAPWFLLHASHCLLVAL